MNEVRSTQLLELMGARQGHFAFESGFHGDIWLDVDGLFARPRKLSSHLDELARRLVSLEPEVVCGPITGGALLAYGIAERLGADLAWTVRRDQPTTTGLFPYRYDLVEPCLLRGRRIAVVDDVINAGSATRATLHVLQEAGAIPIVLAALLTLGQAAELNADDHGIRPVHLGAVSAQLWRPSECPLCETDPRPTGHPCAKPQERTQHD